MERRELDNVTKEQRLLAQSLKLLYTLNTTFRIYK